MLVATMCMYTMLAVAFDPAAGAPSSSGFGLYIALALVLCAAPGAQGKQYDARLMMTGASTHTNINTGCCFHTPPKLRSRAGDAGVHENLALANALAENVAINHALSM
jgi:hypothetical protein